MTFLRGFGLTVALGFSLNSFASVEQPLREIARLGAQSKTIKEFLTRMETKVSPAEAKEMRDYMARPGFTDQPMPKMDYIAPDSLSFEENKSTFILRFISFEKRLFSLNRKTLDFSDEPDFAERVERVLKALPRATKTPSALWAMIVPEARANPVFWALALGISGITGTTVGNVGQCLEVKKALDECRIQKSAIFDYAARKNALLKESIGLLKKNRKTKYAESKEDIEEEDEAWLRSIEDSRKNGAKCGNLSSAPTMDAETAKVVSAGYRLSETILSRLTSVTPICRDSNERLRACSKSLADKGADLCFKVTEDLRDDLNWEEKDGKGAPPSAEKVAPRPGQDEGQR